MSDNPTATSSVLNVTEYIKIAKEQQKLRKQAPPVTASENISIARKQLIQQCAPDCIDKYEMRRGVMTRTKKAPYHPNWVEMKDLKRWAMRGYEPVVWEGSPVIEDSDILVKCPAKLFEDKLARSKGLSDSWTKEPSKVTNQVKGAVTESMDVISPDDPRHEKVLADPSSAIPEHEE